MNYETGGKPLVAGQITSIFLALKVVFESIKDPRNFDRELEFALYQLGVKAQQIFLPGHKAGVHWPALITEDLLRISYVPKAFFVVFGKPHPPWD
jgi:hypothetical protein